MGQNIQTNNEIVLLKDITKPFFSCSVDTPEIIPLRHVSHLYLPISIRKNCPYSCEINLKLLNLNKTICKGTTSHGPIFIYLILTLPDVIQL